MRAALTLAVALVAAGFVSCGNTSCEDACALLNGCNYESIWGQGHSCVLACQNGNSNCPECINFHPDCAELGSACTGSHVGCPIFRHPP